LTLPDIREKLVSQGMDPLVSTPQQFAALIRTDLAKFTQIIKRANIELDQ
jgi:tripartite-type tricarboxylate transporter receptor subunit TctC